MSSRVVCQKGGAKLDAPESLVGKKGKCPKCGTIFVIRAEPISAIERKLAVHEAAPLTAEKSGNRKKSAIVVDNLPSLNSNEGVPKRIDYNNFYVILGNERTVAFWKRGEGWQLNTGHGFASARQENQMIPEQGVFALVEGIVRETENGKRLKGIQFFKIDGRGSLNSIGRGDTEILEKITGRTTLTMAQKRHLLQFIREKFFSSFTEEAAEIIEFLTGEDFHSEQVGDCSDSSADGLPHEE